MRPIEFTEAGDPVFRSVRGADCVAHDLEARAKQRFREDLGCGKKGDFISREAAIESARLVKQLRLAKRVDHVDEVFDSDTLPWVLFLCGLLLGQKLQDNVVGVVAASVAVDNADKDGDCHA